MGGGPGGRRVPPAFPHRASPFSGIHQFRFLLLDQSDPPASRPSKGRSLVHRFLRTPLFRYFGWVAFCPCFVSDSVT